MLIIDREPIYKNKFFLGGVAVLSGFVLTMGVIRLVNPVNDTTSQSTQSGSDRRAASLIPISASDSESSSEGSSSDTASSDNAGAGVASSSALNSQPSGSNWSSTGSQPATQSQQASAPSTSAPSGQSSTGSTGDSGQSGGNPTDGATCVIGNNGLGIPLTGTLLNGVCI